MSDVETYGQALDVCVADMQSGSLRPFETAALDFVRTHGVRKFQDNHPAWPQNRDKVRRAAMFIGRFAELYAAFDESPTVTIKHMTSAIADVRTLCAAASGSDGGKGAWCPDPPAGA